MAVDKTKWVRGNNLAATDFDFDDTNNTITVKTDALSSVGQALAGLTVEDASATQAGIVNLTDGQVLGAGSKVIDGVQIGRKNSSGINIGNSSTVAAFGGTSVGDGANTSNEATVSGVAVGAGATATGETAATALGAFSVASGENSIAIGGANNFGDNPQLSTLASAPNTTAVGMGARATHTNSSTLGAGAVTTKNNQVVLGGANVTEVLTAGNYVGDNFIGRVHVGADFVDVTKCELIQVVDDGGGTILAFTGNFEAGRVYSWVVETTHVGGVSPVPLLTLSSDIKWEGGVGPTLTPFGTDILGFYTVGTSGVVRVMVLSKDNK